MKSTFSIITLFLCLSLIGFSLIPLLPFQLEPSRSLPSLTIALSWPDAPAELIESQATSVLEGAFATLRNLEKMSSTTTQGSARINLRFDEKVDLDMRRFESSAIIRQLYPQLPEELSYPQLTANRPDESQSSTLMSFTLNGNSAPYLLETYADEHFNLPLSQIEGISEVEIYGASPFVWELRYDAAQLRSLGLSVGDLQEALGRYGEVSSLGQLEGKAFQIYPGDFDWENIPLKQHQGRLLYLRDLLTVHYVEKDPDRYFRLNGLNTLNISLKSAPLANQIQLAERVNEVITQLKTELPPAYSLVKTYDATEYLEEELDKVAYRSFFTLLILLIFVLIISRSFRYLLLISVSLSANLAIAAIAYYSLSLEMHIYSLAGITVSLGLLIDNSIVMIDHLRHQNNQRVFLAILAATLTSLAALSVIFFLPESQQVNLIDFAWVMLINLAVSLAIALWFIPALVYRFPLKAKSIAKRRGSLKRISYWQNLYAQWIRLSLKLRPLLSMLLILAFGLPVFLLPEKWNEDEGYYGYGEKEDEEPVEWYETYYDQIIGSRTYQQDIKPWVDKILGGTLRLFIEETFPNYRNRSLERTVLHVKGKMPYGTTVQQMNEAFISLENFLSQFEEIEQYETRINSSQQASLRISFKPEYERKGFPFFLKSRVESHVIDLGAVDWNVYGIGQGFSNAIGFGSKSSRIQMRGYNYEQLTRYSEALKDRLLEHPRIKEVFLNGQIRWDYRPNDAFVMELDPGQLRLRELQPVLLMEQLRNQDLEPHQVQASIIQGRYAPIYLTTQNRNEQDIWKIRHEPLRFDSLDIQLEQVASLRKIPAGNVIYKEDQQYHIYVEYDFIGPGALSRRVRQQMTEDTQARLPLGYTAQTIGWGGWWDRDIKVAYSLIFLVLAMIFGICAILLESLRQPFAVIAMIPISCIGVFLTFYVFEFNFDQGGYAAFLLLSGISVNSALYIINDYNQFKKIHSHRSSQENYLKAFRHKLMPIALTILSTLLGLIPFVMAGQDEAFWFTLAVGTIGGLIFSLLAVGLFLPMWVIKRRPPFFTQTSLNPDKSGETTSE